jgi:uncharacterized membrane protein YeaQ/YmgE (transglycosylase-associated protein family)
MRSYLAGLFGALIAGAIFTQFGSGSSFKLVYILGVMGSSVACYEFAERLKKK